MKKFAYLLFVSVFPFLMFSDAHAQSEADLKAIKARLLKVIQVPEPFTVTGTMFPGYFAARFPRDEFAPVYFDSEMRYAKNFHSMGWHHLPSGRKLNESEELRLRQQIFSRLPLDKAIRIDRGGRAVLVEASAVDCPYCQLQERKLSTGADSWYVFPRYLSKENRALAIDIYCSSNPAEAWLALMVEKKRPPQQVDCGYPDTDMFDIKAMISTGAPLALFKTGVFIRGEHEQKMQQAIRAAKSQALYFD